ncbi:MAG: SusD/RagB family nutrient-binding outer membrane lipoprotein [Porphyromonadaceae bacterium]|nr:MAG: SusD/RagB family nutrient-binding outer membrane lipoprotein [Porphyromonadaceae bacterium]
MMALSTTSCDDFLDVNKNTDAPDYVEGYLYLAGIQQAYYGIYYDLRALCPLTQMMGTSSYTNFANNYYTAASDAGGEAWRMVYWNQGMNLENMINQSEAAENWTLAGIGYAIKAYSWDFLTKVNGEAPMKQAFVPGLLSHEYDYQDAIYDQVRVWAKKAIECLEKEDKTNYGTRISQNDYIYGGDKAKWIKFAYAVIARNLASLTNKNDFKQKYYDEFIDACNKAFASNDDNALVKITGGGADAAQSAYNNFWGPYRGNLSNVYWQHDFAVQTMTGTMPIYNEEGNKITHTIIVKNDKGEDVEQTHPRFPYELAEKQIICDTLEEVGHFDPRPLLKLGTASGNDTTGVKDPKLFRKYYFKGSGFTGATGPIGQAENFWGRTEAITDAKDGEGRWLYSNGAPYVLTTYAEVLFDLAEVQFKYGSKADAFETWKKAIAADMEFSAKYIQKESLATVGGKVYHQGDKVDQATFKAMAQEYLNGPFVAGLPMSEFSLSHIMMQKYIALFPWGAPEVWVDLRKYHFDIAYTGDVPSFGNGWDKTLINQKRDDDATKVYKGFYLAPANVQNRRSAYNEKNNGAPCYRLRPRYNSEYMWNLNNLKAFEANPRRCRRLPVLNSLVCIPRRYA